MGENRSFARDWQLLKLTRDWKPKDRSNEIVQRLLAENDTTVNAHIDAILNDMAKKDAADILQRMHSQMDKTTLIEGILLISGIAYDTANDGQEKRYMIRKAVKSSEANSVFDVNMNPVYLRSFIETIAPESEILDRGDHFTLVMQE